jgi:rare lipoprotein A
MLGLLTATSLGLAGLGVTGATATTPTKHASAAAVRAPRVVAAQAVPVREAVLPVGVAPSAAASPTRVATPEPADADSWHGRASWYGDAFAGRRTASGARFDPAALTAAHRTLPFGTRVRVTLDATGRSVVVTITDRGPHVAGREIDLSRAAATAIGLTARGVGEVTLTRVGS